MSPKKATDEMAVMLSEEEVGGYKIKPWSFGRFKKVLPPLLAIIPALKDMGITVDNAEKVFREKWLDIIMLFPEAMGHIGEIIAISLDIQEEEVDEIDPEQILVIAVAIIAQNIGRIKNSLPLIMGQIKAMTGAA